MNNPILTHLFYELELSPGLDFNNPPPIEQELSDFKLVLNSGKLEIIMKCEVHTEAEGRKIVDPYLKSWEVDYFLSTGLREFSFKFNNSIIIDKNPDRKGDKIIHAGFGEIVLISNEVNLKMTKKEYPAPNFSLTISPDVETLLSRYEGFLNNKEPLLSMAYFCLTIIEATGDKSISASSKFQISKKVLKKIGELTSQRGDMKESRKLTDRKSFDPLTTKEIDWIIQATRQLIRRRAEYGFNPSGKHVLIDMNSLPTLE